MRSRFLQHSRTRAVAIALGAGVLASFAAAPASSVAATASPPPLGQPCQLDGKISGRGSTFQNAVVNSAFIEGYELNDCGAVGNATNLNTNYAGSPNDPAGTTAGSFNGTVGVTGAMIAYNSYAGANTGSGAGLNGMDCRTDMFAGTDTPYNNTQLSQLSNVPGTEVGGNANCNITNKDNETAPYGPAVGVGSPTGGTGATGSTGTIGQDARATMMAFPISAGAEGIGVNLNTICTSGTPASLSFTSQQFEQIFEGTINQWNDPSLEATNPALATDNCSGPIKRVVRLDNSGTTSILKYDLGNIEAGPEAAANGGTEPNLCDTTAGATWAALSIISPNTAWPDQAGGGTSCVDSQGHAASAVVRGTSNGSPALIAAVAATPGGIGYAELGLWPSTLPTGEVFASLEDASDTTTFGYTANVIGTGSGQVPATAFVSPGSPGSASTCNFSSDSLPAGGTPNGAVGLGGTNLNWSNQSNPQTVNTTFAGTAYPVCGLTFDTVYKGVSPTVAPNGATGSTVVGANCGAAGTSACPLEGVTFDQLRTMYNYFSYVLSPVGQEGATINGVSTAPNSYTYDQLPASWLDPLRQGFQSNF